MKSSEESCTSATEIAEVVETKGTEFFRFLGFYKKKWLVVIVTLFSIGCGVVPFVLMLIIAKSLNAFTEPGDEFTDEMVGNVLGITYVAIAQVVLLAFNFYFRGIATPTCAHDIRCAIFSNLLKMEISYYDTTTTGVLVSRISEDVTFAIETYMSKFQDNVQADAQILAGIVISFVLCWRLALIALVPFALCAIVYPVAERYSSKVWETYKDVSAAAGSKAEEVITSFRTVKSFDNELYESDSYTSKLLEDHEIIKKSGNVQAIKNFLLELIVWGSVPVIMWFGAYFLLVKTEYNVEFGSVFIVASCAATASQAVALVFNIVEDFRKANLSAAKVLQLIERKPEFDLKEGDTLTEGIRGKIEFRDVCFSYNTRKSLVLDHLSFTINPGETVAFVGESGCGKTTTLQLIQRFYEIDSGEILVDDHNVNLLSSHFLRSQIAIVPQNPVLFSMSIMDNIRFSRPEETDDNAIEAARIGNAHDFIVELPESYETKIQQTSLSGGQKQRICISRAILANVPILLLDEATAALDTESERLVQDSLERYRHGKTAIIVAHRLSTVKNADRIFVFQAGKIVEIGTHDQLIANNGIYADLVKYQLQ